MPEPDHVKQMKQGDAEATTVEGEERPEPPQHDMAVPVLVGRGAFGGVLMGLANLVPGISGGTMLLAAGIYPRFIEAVADVTTLKWRRSSLILLAVVALAAGLAILGLAGVVQGLVLHQRWIMYSLFIGLTLGGAPLLWRMIGRHSASMWLGATGGFAAMVVLAVIQARGGGGAGSAGWGMMFAAGVAGASAMILPGVSGGYLLLVLGVYVPLLGAIDQLKDALPVIGEFDGPLFWELGWSVVLPVGLGVAVGIAGIANLLKWLLARFERPGLGVLLGLLLGAVVGLWPFQQGVPPEPGTSLKGMTVALAEASPDDAEPAVEPQPVLVYTETGEAVEAEDWPTAFFRPSAGQVAGSLAIIAGGFALSLLVTRLGGGKDDA